MRRLRMRSRPKRRFATGAADENRKAESIRRGGAGARPVRSFCRGRIRRLAAGFRSTNRARCGARNRGGSGGRYRPLSKPKAKRRRSGAKQARLRSRRKRARNRRRGGIRCAVGLRFAARARKRQKRPRARARRAIPKKRKKPRSDSITPARDRKILPFPRKSLSYESAFPTKAPFLRKRESGRGCPLSQKQRATRCRRIRQSRSGFPLSRERESGSRKSGEGDNRSERATIARSWAAIARRRTAREAAELRRGFFRRLARSGVFDAADCFVDCVRQRVRIFFAFRLPTGQKLRRAARGEMRVLVFSQFPAPERASAIARL